MRKNHSQPQPSTTRAHHHRPKAQPSEVLIGEIVGQGEDAYLPVRVGDWSLAAFVGRGESGEPRIRDLDMAGQLGYADPHKFRTLVRRLERAGKFKRYGFLLKQAEISSDGDGRGRPGIAYWLTKKQAVKALAKAETTIADEYLDKVIDVFDLASRGLLPGAALDPAALARIQSLESAMARVLAVNESLTAQLLGESRARLLLESKVREVAEDSGLIGAERAGWVRGRIREIARLEADPGKPYRRRRQSIENALRNKCQFTGPGTRWEQFENGRAYRMLAIELGALYDQALARVLAKRQLSLFKAG